MANSAAWRSVEIPSSNGHGTARALARLYGALACDGSVDGIRILSPERIDEMRSDQTRGEDAVLLTETRFGMGFMKSVPGAAMGPNDGAFGHPGTGGSVGFADPDEGVGFGLRDEQVRLVHSNRRTAGGVDGSLLRFPLDHEKQRQGAIYDTKMGSVLYFYVHLHGLCRRARTRESPGASP